MKVNAMKEVIIKYVSDILTSLNITTPFEVFECKVDILPEWTKQIQITHEYLICCGEIIEKNRLQSFIGKSILEYNNTVFWYEGDFILERDKVEFEFLYDKPQKEIDYLKTETRLPTFLDDFIFNQLNAKYAPDYNRFDYNLDLTKEENQIYLGTYFPRSYAESFCIFDNIFQNIDYIRKISENNSVNILSVGCGTGGDLIGLITIIEKYCQEISEINIWALDGNTEALSILERIIDKFKNISSKKINIRIVRSKFKSICDIDLIQINELNFDFIISFKLICEIISMGEGRLDNSYYDFIHKFVPMLSENGLCVLLDVTTKPQHTTYNPILMNRQVNQALRELKSYKTLLPISCELYSSDCYFDCFCQKTFTVTHSSYAKDKSKVAYRIIANIDLVNNIGNINSNSKLLINNGVICPFTENNYEIEDAYLLK